MGYFLGQHNPSNYFALTKEGHRLPRIPAFPLLYNKTYKTREKPMTKTIQKKD